MAEIKDYDKIIARLNDDKEYYGEFGSQYLHNSDINTLINNPMMYGEKREDTLPMLIGRTFHEMLLFNNHSQPYIDASTRSTKIYKTELEEYDEQLVLLKKEYEQIVELKNKAANHQLVADVLKDKSIKKEVPNVGTLTDNLIEWACKADIVTMISRRPHRLRDSVINHAYTTTIAKRTSTHRCFKNLCASWL